MPPTPVDKTKECDIDDKTKATFYRKGYIVETLLGQGSFGEVYKGWSIKMDKPCAVKVMSLEKMDPRYQEQFLPRELAGLMEAKHTNIIRVHDIFKSRKRIYIFMDYASNGDVTGFLKANGPLSEDKAHEWFTQTARAVQYLHDELSTAHRDIKIDNLLLDDDFSVKLSDFGFAVDSMDDKGNILLRQTYCGSKPYSSPQILIKTPYDPYKADVWAMGVVLFVMLHRKFPFHFQDKDPKRMIGEQKDIAYKTSKLNPKLTTEVKQLILAMFEFEEAQRPSISDVLQHRWILMRLQE